jgi:hypothetical protein
MRDHIRSAAVLAATIMALATAPAAHAVQTGQQSRLAVHSGDDTAVSAWAWYNQAAADGTFGEIKPDTSIVPDAPCPSCWG